MRPVSGSSAVNIDWSPYHRIAGSPILNRLARLALDDDRRARLASVPDNILVHDLRKGIPFPDCSVDTVYHSHVLEHIDRDQADGFMHEVRRVLRPGGTQRIVVPDLELFVRRYIESLDRIDKGEPADSHDDAVAQFLEQSVRREASGTAVQSSPRRLVENVVLGGARRRGETHQWMYDRVNLEALLRRNGFIEVVQQSHASSRIAEWDELGRGLDMEADGTEYKDHSLYIEAVRP